MLKEGVMTVIDVVLGLKNDPSNGKIELALNELVDEELVTNLEVIMTVITVVCPVYPSLQENVKNQLLTLISGSYAFMSNLISYSKVLDYAGKKVELQLYQDIIVSTLRQKKGTLCNYFLATKSCKQELDLLKSIFFGSKLYNILATSISIVDYIDLIKLQFKFFINENGSEKILSYQTIGELLTSLFSLNPQFTVSAILEEFFLSAEVYWEVYKNIISKSKKIVQKTLLTSYLIPYLDTIVTENNFEEIYKFLSQLQLQNTINLVLLLKLRSDLLRELLIKVAPEVLITKLKIRVLESFGNFNEYDDDVICQIFCMILEYRSDKEQKAKISNGSTFLNAVTTRLANNEMVVRERTMYIAKLVTDGTLEYESSFKIYYPNHNVSNISSNDNINFDKLRLRAEKEIELINKTEMTLPQSFNELKLTVDSDDDDEDFNKKKIVFVKDLLLEFEVLDKSKRNDLITLLKTTVKLIRQKKNFPSEVSYYAPKLTVNICTLNNNFDEKDFEEWRINSLETIVYIVPESVKNILQVLFTTELSLQQRMSILSSLGLAARELRGIDDKFIVKHDTDFATQKLPWLKDEQQLLASKNNELESSNNEIIKSSQVNWKSQKLLKQVNPSIQNNFRKYSKLFFYPLANQWLNGIDLGTYDKMFKLHYIQTLQMIYQCSFPSNDYESMTELYRIVLNDAIKQNLPIENILTSEMN